jgi:site-specific DNA recombinase
MRWNGEDQWIYSEQIVHPQIISEQTFQRVRDLMAVPILPGERKLRPSRHSYMFRGLLRCGLCDRRMQGHQANGEPYDRCRPSIGTASVHDPDHPRHITVRQSDIVGPLDNWLHGRFEPQEIAVTVDELTAAATPLKTEGKDAGAAVGLASDPRG